ncbi:MAG: glycine betaine ABC transporter substrate-binding protein [Sciscionella sp.]
MSNIFSRDGGAARRGFRRGSIVASLAAVSLAAAACGGGGGSGTTSGGGGAGGSSSSQASCGSTKANPGGGSASADTKSITASNGQLPQGTPGKGKPSVNLGDKNFPEEYLLGSLYQQALQAKGFTVSVKKGVGGSETIDKAFQSGQIDMYPEYLGEIVTSVAQQKPQKSAKATYDVAKKFEESKRDATLLKQTPYQDVDVLFVKTDFCKKYNLKSIADLKKVGTNGQGVKYSAQPSARTRLAGFKGLKDVYGLTAAQFVGADVGQSYKAVDTGAANVGDGFSTDPALGLGLDSGKYRTLTDPQHIMGFQYVAPVIKKSVVQQQGPAFEQTLNWVDSLLTQKAILQLNKAVQVQHQSEDSVAKKFLSANGLKG